MESQPAEFAPTIARCVCLGSGSFGTALGIVLARKGHRVTILARKAEVAEAINETRHNPRALSEFRVPDSLDATHDPAIAFREKPMYIIHTVPVQSSYDYIKGIAQYIPETAIYILCSKGLDVQRNQFMVDLLPESLGRDQPQVSNGILAGRSPIAPGG